MDAILLAAGRSIRMGKEMEKQLIRLGGKPMFIFSLEKLLEHPAIERVIITCPPGKCRGIESFIEDYQLGPCKCIEGGATRQESVYLALREVNTSRVLIHEAARPMITGELISRVVAYENEKAVVPTVEVPFTISIGNEYMEKELDRSLLRNIQLPQVFDTDTIRKAHEVAREANTCATEDSMLVFRMGEKIRFVRGNIENIKVTWPVDLLFAMHYIFGWRETL